MDSFTLNTTAADHFGIFEVNGPVSCNSEIQGLLLHLRQQDRPCSIDMIKRYENDPTTTFEANIHQLGWVTVVVGKDYISFTEKRDTRPASTTAYQCQPLIDTNQYIHHDVWIGMHFSSFNEDKDAIDDDKNTITILNYMSQKQTYIPDY